MSSKDVLSMTAKEAKKFFLKGESYCNIALPQYFNFGPYLKKLSVSLGNKKLGDVINDKKRFPKCFDDVNYKFFNNKDGKYEWRMFQLIHPIIYITLLNEIIENWDNILQRIKFLSSNSKIRCASIPVESKDKYKDLRSQILKWWDDVEQESLRLSLKFSYMMQTDITNCYPSIYTHALAWAMHGKEFMKKEENRDNKTFLGNKIDFYIRNMQYGQTNGIPQGSVLMDFISEILFSYMDYLLGKKIESAGITNYEIIRYRDDYRIFSNDPLECEEIFFLLNSILADFGFKVNSKKTIFSDNLILHSIKKDKIDLLSYDKDFSDMQKRLLHIYNFSTNHINSGQLIRLLDSFYNDINKENVRDVDVLLAIITDIILRNPRICPIGIAIISKLLSNLSLDMQKERIKLINEKFKKISNNAYIEIWLQRIALIVNSDIGFKGVLCQIIIQDNNELPWNSEWLNDKFKEKLDFTFVDQKELQNLKLLVHPKEFRTFYSKYLM